MKGKLTFESSSTSVTLFLMCHKLVSMHVITVCQEIINHVTSLEMTDLRSISINRQPKECSAALHSDELDNLMETRARHLIQNWTLANFMLGSANRNSFVVEKAFIISGRDNRSPD